MNKKWIALTALLCTLALTACSGGNQTETSGSTKATTPAGTTSTVTTSGTTTQSPAVTTEDPGSVPSTPEQPIDPGTPNNREEGKDYHLSSLIIPTNSQNLDAEYLLDNTAQSNGDYRYADGSGCLIYRVDLTDKIDPTIDLLVLQNYYITVANNPDFNNEIKVVNYADEHPGTLTSGGNDTTITIDPYEYGFYKEIYIAIMDSDPTDGWGGTIRNMTIREYVEGAGEDVEINIGDEG